ncbi:hypothetical protein COY17_00035 [Candidatus Saccharibacteria bacterium CG_4_10_14_0_2_um_filter_52_9]|nr:MAG: hypothetical protein COY17_00035 [Candidatus Saccharibacteria bacterium CG_4_10_14_0_2_um_filter_52_9]
MTDNQQSAKPAIIVIFGITGDLSQRYLLPSLYHLVKDGLLHDKTEIIGVSRRPVTTEDLFEKVELCVNEVDKICDPVALKAMHDRTSMFQMDLADPAAYAKLQTKLDGIEAEKGVCQDRIYYLSIPPQAYRPVVRLMGEQGLNKSCQHGNAKSRLVVEKPFGLDLSSAQQLIAETGQVFQEEQVFRVDHYLAKQAVRTLPEFRAKNPDIEALWNAHQISGITIKAHEKIGIEGRAAFYEPLGALRDFLQSHMMQILGVVTMDLPEVLDSQHIHAAKAGVMQQIEPVPADQVLARAVRGQYEGYRQEVNNPTSNTETYIALTLYIDSPRWQGVPVELSTGKALNERRAEIIIDFHESAKLANNQLRFEIQHSQAGQRNQPDAYEKVLADAISGDHTLFASDKEVLASWQVLQPLVEAWQKSSDDLVIYAKGSSDPQAPGR